MRGILGFEEVEKEDKKKEKVGEPQLPLLIISLMCRGGGLLMGACLKSQACVTAASLPCWDTTTTTTNHWFYCCCQMSGVKGLLCMPARNIRNAMPVGLRFPCKANREAEQKEIALTKCGGRG